MRTALGSITAVSVLLVAACGENGGASEAPGAPQSGAAATQNGSDEQSTDNGANAAEDAQTILAALGEPYISANIENGARLWRRCQSCHTVGEGDRHMVGPNLHNMFGSQAGTAEGFRYSAALEEAGFIWSPQELDEWLANPRTYLPGNRMSFAGLRNESDRNDLIAWLAVNTAE